MELTVELVLAAFASARWSQLVVYDSFGPIRDTVTAIKYRYPDADDAYYESEVVGHEDVGWETKHGLAVFPELEQGVRVFYPVDPHPIGTLLSCVRCMSVWTGLAATALVLLAPAWITLPVLAPFAFSQFAIWITRNE